MLKIRVRPDASMNSSSPTDRPLSSEISRNEASIAGSGLRKVRQRRGSAAACMRGGSSAPVAWRHGRFIWQAVGVLAT